jgi:site-specific DNA recombinase
MDAHWVHGRPGYRCRHGHTSSRSPNTPRATSLYVREDHILTTLPGHVADLGPRSSGASAQTTDQGQTVAFLRTNNLLIICDTSGWTLQATIPNPSTR